MKPDRSNYEIWFIDRIEGNLTDQEVQELDLFLRDNPDLREELESFSFANLQPEDRIYQGKELLKKSAASYSPEQFDHLCIANLEHDLNAGQFAELAEIISHDDQKRRTFELISKLRLVQGNEVFTKKRSVKKLTTGQKILRISVLGLSAAATVAILVIAWLALPENPADETGQIAINGNQDTLRIRSARPVIKIDPLLIQEPVNTLTEIQETIAGSGINELNPVPSEQIRLAEDTTHSLYLRRADPVITFAVTVSPETITVGKPPATSLIAFKSAPLPPFFDDGRSNVERFFAKFFHEKIMRDPASAYEPVETYELAEAGLNGLNRLFGWELALQRNTDDKGELKSYYFSSRLLKFNAPVKKTAKEL